MFALKYYGGYSLIETYNMPIGMRKWTVQRLIKQKEQEKQLQDDSKRKS